MSRYELCSAHARTLTFKRRVEQAKVFLDDALCSSCSSWYVALSGGKDSTVIHHLVGSVAPSVSYVQRWMLPQTEDYLKSIHNLNVVCSRDTDDIEYDDPRWDSEAAARAIWPTCTWLETTRAACDVGLGGYGRPEPGVMMGLRIAESRGRAMNAWKRGPLYQVKAGGWRCNPISYWTTMDVWAYIYSRDVAYNAAYDIMETIGIPLERQRIAELIGSALSLGSAVTIKRGWPDLWNRLAAVTPEVRQYA